MKLSMFTPKTLAPGDVIGRGKLNLPVVITQTWPRKDGGIAYAFRHAHGYAGGQGWWFPCSWIGTRYGSVPLEKLGDDGFLADALSRFTPTPNDPEYPELSYFAISDSLPGPDGKPRLTFWMDATRRWTKRAPDWTYKPWPPLSPWPGPALRGFPDHDTHLQAELTYRAEVEKRIEADPLQAAARFASLHAHCAYCGKPLTHEESVTYGVGSACRTKLPKAALARHAEWMRSLHSEGETQAAKPPQPLLATTIRTVADLPFEEVDVKSRVGNGPLETRKQKRAYLFRLPHEMTERAMPDEPPVTIIGTCMMDAGAFVRRGSLCHVEVNPFNGMSDWETEIIWREPKREKGRKRRRMQIHHEFDRYPLIVVLEDLVLDPEEFGLAPEWSNHPGIVRYWNAILERVTELTTTGPWLIDTVEMALHELSPEGRAARQTEHKRRHLEIMARLQAATSPETEMTELR